MQPRRRASALGEFVDLFSMELTNWRWSWRLLVFGGAVAPLALMVGLGVYARDYGEDALSYVLTGSIVLTIVLGNMDTLQSRFVFMRQTGTLDYYRTLPIRRTSLIAAIIASFLLLSLPAVATTVVIGPWILDVDVDASPFLLFVVPLAAIPMATIGAAIGLISPTPQTGNLLRFVAALALLAIGPVVFPPEKLPEIAQRTGWLSPATYAASALRQTLIGPVTSRLLLDLLALLGFSLLGMWFVVSRLDWRRE